MSLSTLFQAAFFYLSLALFGAWAGAVSLVCLLGAWLRPTPRTEQFFQRLIHGQVAGFVRWLRFGGAVTIEYRGWENVTRSPAVIVANHPGLLDAFFLLARVRHGFCIFKPAIRRNPALGAAARRAGYLASDTGVELVRRATERIAGGSSLIVFPEGTRTPVGESLGTLRPGFALIAQRAEVLVQLVRISSPRDFLGKGRAWWKPPQLPARIVVEAGPCLDPNAVASTSALVAEVEAWFRSARPPAAATHSELSPGIERPLTPAPS